MSTTTTTVTPSTTTNSNSHKLILKKTLTEALNNITGNTGTILLIPQKHLVKILNGIIKYSELTQIINVEKIITEYIPEATNNNITLLYDIRSFKPISSDIIIDANIKNIIYCTWGEHLEEERFFVRKIFEMQDSGSSNEDARMEMNLIPWCMLPIEVDANVYITDACTDISNTTTTIASNCNDNSNNNKMVELYNLENGIFQLIKTLDIWKINKVIYSTNNNDENDNDRFMDRLIKNFKNTGMLKSSTVSSNDDLNIIVIDRNVDNLTPLLTQLTYQGIITEVNASATINTPDNNTFNELKYKNFGDIGPILNDKLVELSALKKDIKNKNTSSGSTSDLHNILFKKLPDLENLQKDLSKNVELSHLLLTEYEKQGIDEFVNIEQDLLMSLGAIGISGSAKNSSMDYKSFKLKIISLLLMGGGDGTNIAMLPRLLRLIYIHKLLYANSNNIEELMNLIVDHYGAETLKKISVPEYICSTAMDTTNTLSGNGNMLKLMKKLEYIPNVEDNNNATVNNNTLSYAYCGIVPIITRILQYSLKYSCTTPTLKHVRDLNNILKIKEWGNSSNSGSNGTNPTLLVVIIGGITFSELSTIKKAYNNGTFNNSKQNTKHNDNNMIIISNNIIDGNNLVLK
ncbi:tethering complex ATP-binding subunit VPS33 SCDLUD_004263 [Saccharomycodes ludwigii]|uniref:tethering complex ATP-binding subunit VPS33 n=1 Tax=Saccharomycodes ludwigii TaxID=36035 RepID=UPI001E8B7421|nr:hypothetical protein SCDLUD_004263 [Saccharomycodes ludwigii]KAH3899947.1 hypothetical protein SCDLUD_004263 [Saccharomycodes ludwigii]